MATEHHRSSSNLTPEERKALYKAVDSVIDTLKGLKDFDLLYITDANLGE